MDGLGLFNVLVFRGSISLGRERFFDLDDGGKFGLATAAS